MKDKVIVDLDDYLRIKRKAREFDRFKNSLKIRDLGVNTISGTIIYEVTINANIFSAIFDAYILSENGKTDCIRIDH